MPASSERSGPFPRSQRIRTAREFAAVKAASQRWTAGLVIVQARIRSSDEPVPPSLRRVGIIASRRVGDSVRRQRAKRLLREAWRWERDFLPAGTDAVLVARPGLPAATSVTVRAQLRTAFERLASRLTRAAATAPVSRAAAHAASATPALTEPPAAPAPPETPPPAASES